MKGPSCPIQPDRWAGLLLAFTLLAALLVWPGSSLGPFQFDDWNVIVEQPAVHSASAWWQSMPGMRPLLKLSYALNWIFSAEAAGFHWLNLAIHAVNAVLVWHLLCRWPQMDRLNAAWGTLVFALHPVQTEAVTYISGRSMSLMACFWLLSACFWLQGSFRSRCLAGLFFVMAIAVRETALTLPLVLLAWYCLSGMSLREALRSTAPLWGILLLGSFCILLLPTYRHLLGDALSNRAPLDNLALQLDGLRYLLVHVVLGLHNNIDPDLPVVAGDGPVWWASLLVCAALVVQAWRWRRSWPGLALAILWLPLLLVLTNGPLARFEVVAERHLYLAILGPALLLGAVLRAVLPTPLCGAVMLGLGLTISWATRERIGDYRSESALWQATALVSPGKARVWNNLGYARLAEGDPEGAKAALRRALELDPSFMRAQINLERAEAAQLRPQVRPPLRAP